MKKENYSIYSVRELKDLFAEMCDCGEYAAASRIQSLMNKMEEEKNRNETKYAKQWTPRTPITRNCHDKNSHCDIPGASAVGTVLCGRVQV